MSTVENAVKAPVNVKLPIYMDDHATTPMDPRVLEFYRGDISLVALKPRDAERLSEPRRQPRTHLERQPAAALPWVRSVGRIAGGRSGERVLAHR